MFGIRKKGLRDKARPVAIPELKNQVFQGNYYFIGNSWWLSSKESASNAKILLVMQET